MLKLKQYENELIKVIDKLPEDKVIEVLDFAKFIQSQHSHISRSQIDKSSLLLSSKKEQMSSFDLVLLKLQW